jgi:hypothetical protein
MKMNNTSIRPDTVRLSKVSETPLPAPPAAADAISHATRSKICNVIYLGEYSNWMDLGTFRDLPPHVGFILPQIVYFHRYRSFY